MVGGTKLKKLPPGYKKDPGGEKGEWLATYTGTWILPLDPDPKAITIDDIAHALSNQCRFTGHTRRFYSTAQHSVLVSSIVPESDMLWGLLHDASEAYLSDIARPIKHAAGSFGKTYKRAEAKLTLAIAERFGLPLEMPASIKDADRMLLRAEQRDLMPNDPSEGPIYDKYIDPWGPAKAERKFLERFKELT